MSNQEQYGARISDDVLARRWRRGTNFADRAIRYACNALSVSPTKCPVVVLWFLPEGAGKLQFVFMQYGNFLAGGERKLALPPQRDIHRRSL